MNNQNDLLVSITPLYINSPLYGPPTSIYTNFFFSCEIVFQIEQKMLLTGFNFYKDKSTNCVSTPENRDLHYERFDNTGHTLQLDGACAFPEKFDLSAQEHILDFVTKKMNSSATFDITNDDCARLKKIINYALFDHPTTVGNLKEFWASYIEKYSVHAEQYQLDNALPSQMPSKLENDAFKL